MAGCTSTNATRVATGSARPSLPIATGASRPRRTASPKDIAEDWYLTLRGKLKAGTLKHEKTFRQAAEQFRTEYEAITEGERNEAYVEGHWRRLKIHLNPFFGDLGLSEVTRAKVQEYRAKRRKEIVKGKETTPARSTLHQEIVTLRQVLKTAEMHGWINAVPNLSAPYKTSGKITHRAWFGPEEYKQLYTATRARIEHPKEKRYIGDYEDLHDYVPFMANTGLRPDESLRLQFRDVKIVDDVSSGETILEIDVRGKRGVGLCKSMPGGRLSVQARGQEAQRRAANGPRLARYPPRAFQHHS
jgi:integrase